MDSKRSKSPYERVLRNRQKRDRGGLNKGQYFFGYFCQKADQTFGQTYPNPKKQIAKIFFLEATKAWIWTKFGRAARTSLDKNMVQKCPELTKFLPRYNINAMHEAFFAWCLHAPVLFHPITGQNGVHLVREISQWSTQVLCIGLVKT